MKRARAAAALTGLAVCVLQACGDPEEAQRVELSVVTDASGLAEVTTDLGYVVELRQARLMVENFAFTIAGETHGVAVWRRLSELVLPVAWAHPGHFQGGEVTGELRGRFELDWLGGGEAELGTAVLLAGTYKSANFALTTATADDGLAASDPLLGHTALLAGSATRGATSVDFTVVIDSPEGRELTGAPFELEVNKATTHPLGVRLLMVDPLEGDTLFDGLDFAALDHDGDGQLSLDSSATEASLAEAYNRLRRTFQTHDHFDLRPPVQD